MAWLNVEDPVVKTTIWERAGSLVKQFSGTPALDKVPTFKRQVVMATSLALSYVYMMQESKAEKYKVAQNTVMLSRPPMWTFLMKNPDDPGNYNYKDSVKLSALNKDTWVQMKIPGVFSEGGMPLYLASPCKADVSVTKGICKCNKYGEGGDKALVRFISHTTVSGKTPEQVQNSITAIINFIKPDSAASCKINEGGEGLTTKILNYLNLPTDGIFKDLVSCPLQTISRFATATAEDAVLSENDVFIEFPNDKYPFKGSIKEYIGDLSEISGKSKLKEDAAKEAEERGMKRSGEFSGAAGTNVKVETKVTYELMNVGPGRDGGWVTHKICTEEGLLDFLKTADELKNKNCIQISVDSTSMGNYATAGFEPNFCRINKGKAENMAQVGIEAGVLIGGVALTLFPVTTAAGTAVLMGVSGGLGAVGSKYIDITSKWPENEY